MSLLPEIERELLRAARRPGSEDQAAPTGRGPRHVPARARDLVFTASLAAVAAVIAVALLVTLHHHGDSTRRPATTSPRPNLITVPVLGAPRTQPGPWSAQRGRPVCPLAAHNRYLPARAGCVSVTEASIEDSEQPDLVLLYATLGRRPSAGGFRPAHFWLVVRALNREPPIGMFELPTRSLPRIVSIANVNGQPGAEIFVQRGRLVAIYAFDGGRIVRSGPAAGLAFGRFDPSVRAQYSCHTTPPARIVEQRFTESAARGWMRTDDDLTWHGSRLTASGQRTVQVPGPPQRLTRAGCSPAAGSNRLLPIPVRHKR